MQLFPVTKRVPQSLGITDSPTFDSLNVGTGLTKGVQFGTVGSRMYEKNSTTLGISIAGNERVTINHPSGTLTSVSGFKSNTQISLVRNVDTSILRLSGGTTSSSGANILLHGISEATHPSKFVFRNNTVENMVLDINGNLSIGVVTPAAGASKTFALASGIAPAASPADGFQMYSSDIVAGNAIPHFRTENGNIIKLYRQGHIIDADGTLTDITTKFNVLLVYLENLGLIATV